MARPTAIVATAALAGAAFAIELVPWEGVAALVMLVVLHSLYGLAVGSWWSLLTPVALWFVLLTVPPCNGELCDAGSKAFFLAWYWVASVALVALGVGARRLLRARRAR